MPDNSLSLDHIWCVIPTYNNKDTIRNVALSARGHLKNILVIDDGSTDIDVRSILLDTDITVLRHDKNKGKGAALMTALKFIKENNAKFMITIDADGQHYVQDIDKFIPLLEDSKESIIVGVRDFNNQLVPGKSRFGRSFSNFWLRLETGVSIEDSQSGFRVYPVKHLAMIKLDGKHYDFEVEVLTRGVWSGLKLRTVPIKVYYPKEGMRVTSFKPFRDNLRISIMHIRLIGRRLFPFPYPRVLPKERQALNLKILLHPFKLLKSLLKENATPLGLAVSAGVGVFLGVLPLLSIHTLVIVYVTQRLHLNKIMALSIQNICMPPFVPIACIELGHFMLYGKWFTSITWKDTLGALGDRVWEWLLGSLILAPLLGLATGLIIYFSARAIKKRSLKNAE